MIHRLAMSVARLPLTGDVRFRRHRVRVHAVGRSVEGVFEFDPDSAFAVFDEQDSGCVSYGVEVDGRRLFVKTAATACAAESLRRAVSLHEAVAHPTIVSPLEVAADHVGPVIVYPWHEGRVLNRSTTSGADRSALRELRRLPVTRVHAAIDSVLDAHLAVAAAGFVAVDLYDGCFLYDFAAHRMRLIDLDEYRPGPFTLEAERLPGSRRYMPPEQSVRGATIDHRSTVFALGRTLMQLLDGPTGWRGSPDELGVADAAASLAPSDRPDTVPELVAMWRASRAAG